MKRLPVLPRSQARPKRKSIAIAPGAQLTLRGKANTRYDIRGWIEIEQTKSGSKLVVANLSAWRRPDPKRKPVRAPHKLHINPGGPLKGKLDADSLRGTIRFPILVAWDELEPRRDETPLHTQPRRMTGTLALTFTPGRGGLLMKAAGSIDWLPPFQREKVPFNFSTPCKVEGAKCGEVQLCVDVANTGTPAAPVISDQQLVQVIAELNRIWGCPGQCCIRFVMAEAGPRRNGRDTVMDRDGNPHDETEMRRQFRELSRRHTARRRCWPVMFTGQLMTGVGGGGQFDNNGTTISRGADANTRGSVIMTGAGTPGGVYSPVSIGATLAHEIGHALGLATAPGNADADGEIHHSTNPNNLLREAGDPRDTDANIRAATRLNAKQCARARNSALVMQTDDDCGNVPLEGV